MCVVHSFEKEDFLEMSRILFRFVQLKSFFSSTELTLCADSNLFSVRSIPVLPPAVGRKRLGHSAKNAGGRLHLG